MTGLLGWLLRLPIQNFTKEIVPFFVYLGIFRRLQRSGYSTFICRIRAYHERLFVICSYDLFSHFAQLQPAISSARFFTAQRSAFRSGVGREQFQCSHCSALSVLHIILLIPMTWRQAFTCASVFSVDFVVAVYRKLAYSAVVLPLCCIFYYPSFPFEEVYA